MSSSMASSQSHAFPPSRAPRRPFLRPDPRPKYGNDVRPSFVLRFHAPGGRSTGLSRNRTIRRSSGKDGRPRIFGGGKDLEASVNRLLSMGMYLEAKALTVEMAAHDKCGLEVAERLFEFARMFLKGDPSSAVEISKRAMEIIDKGGNGEGNRDGDGQGKGVGGLVGVVRALVGLAQAFRQHDRDQKHANELFSRAVHMVDSMSEDWKKKNILYGHVLQIAGVESENKQIGIKLLDRALQATIVVSGPKSINTAHVLNSLGALRTELGDPKMGRADLEKVLVILRHNGIGNDHYELAAPLSNLANAFRALGESDRAVINYTSSLRIKQKYYGARHPVLLSSLHGLSTVLIGLKEYAKAASTLEVACGIALQAKHKREAEVAMERLSNVYGQLKQEKKRLKVLSRLLHLRGWTSKGIDPKRISKKKAEKVAGTLISIGRTLSNIGELAQARGALWQGINLYQDIPISPHSTTLTSATLSLAEINISLGDLKSAEALLNRIVPLFKSSNLPCYSPLNAAISDAYLAQVTLTFRKNPAKAMDLLTNALVVLEKHLSSEEIPVGRVRKALGGTNVAKGVECSSIALDKTKQKDKAEKMLKYSLEIKRKLAGCYSSSTRLSLSNPPLT
ncbi:hypothetical protein AAMO2058_000317900 [Amorphochlora amoebiformis]